MKRDHILLKVFRVALTIMIIAYFCLIIWSLTSCDTEREPIPETTVETIIIDKESPDKYIQDNMIIENGSGNYQIDIKQSKIYVTTEMDIISVRYLDDPEDTNTGYDVPLYNESRRFSIEHRERIAVFRIRY